jgi:hypothetical protein
MIGNRRSHGERDAQEEGVGGLDSTLEGGRAQTSRSLTEVQPLITDGDEGTTESRSLLGIPQGKRPG